MAAEPPRSAAPSLVTCSSSRLLLAISSRTIPSSCLLKNSSSSSRRDFAAPSAMHRANSGRNSRSCSIKKRNFSSGSVPRASSPRNGCPCSPAQIRSHPARTPPENPAAESVIPGTLASPVRARPHRLDRVGIMEYRQLGRSGLRISVLTMGTMTFGGRGPFANVGSTGVAEARRQVDMCLDAGINIIDTADVYSDGLSEEILGEVLTGRRDRVLVATKVRMPMGDGPNDAGLSRQHVISGCEASLRRLGTDHIDLYQVHEWDGKTPLEETLGALDLLIQQGKVRYVGASNYASWQLMKALGTAERLGLPRFVSAQIYYSLQAREAEYELVPLAVDQGLGVLVWSPLAGGLVSGKYRRNHEAPAGPRQPPPPPRPPPLPPLGHGPPPRRATDRHPGRRVPDAERRRTSPARPDQRPAA